MSGQRRAEPVIFFVALVKSSNEICNYAIYDRGARSGAVS